MDYEIYEGRTDRNRKKTFLVFPFRKNFDIKWVIVLKSVAAKHFRVKVHHIDLCTGYVLNDELYFENPRKKGTKAVFFAYWVKED